MKTRVSLIYFVIDCRCYRQEPHIKKLGGGMMMLVIMLERSINYGRDSIRK